MGLPFAAIQAAAASSGNTQATTSTAALLALWSAANTGANNLGSSKDSNYSVRPDKATNRLLVKATGPNGGGTAVPTSPVRVKLRFAANVSASANATGTFRFRKNGTYISGSLRAVGYLDSGLARQVVVEAVVELTAADLQAATAVQAFADPPAGGVVATGFAPYNMVPIDVDVATSASVTLTFTDAVLSAEILN